MAYDVPLRLLSKVKISVKIKGLCECHNCLLFWLSMRPAIRASRFNTGKSNYFFSRSKHFANFSCCRLEIYCITPQNSPFCEGNTRATALFFINELRNRHMLVNPPEEWNEQDKHKTSTRQVTTSMCQTLWKRCFSPSPRENFPSGRWWKTWDWRHEPTFWPRTSRLPSIKDSWECATPTTHDTLDRNICWVRRAWHGSMGLRVEIDQLGNAPRLLAFPLPIYRYFCTLNAPSVKIHTDI